MKEFKTPLEGLFAPDQRSDGELARRHEEMAVLELPEYVPADVRAYYDSTRLLWVFGHLSYPFFGWADLHARIAVERALRRRLGQDGQRTGLGALLRLAVQRELLTDKGLAGFHETIDLRLEEREREVAVRELTLLLDVPPEEVPEVESFVESLVGPLARGRNLGVHEAVAAEHTPRATKETIKLARAIIIRLFRGAPHR